MSSPTDTLNVTLIQSDLHWENPAANLDMFESKINSVEERMEVVILPEMFSTGFSMAPEKLAESMEGNSVAWMKRMAAEKRIILVGSLIIEENEKYYNRLLWVLPNGECGVYDKRHLFGYAGEGDHYSAGQKRLITSVKGWKVNLLVCYDLRFPVWSRQSAPIDLDSTSEPEKEIVPEFDLLIYVANWPEKRNKAWKTLLQARAIENQCYVAGVNRVGTDGTGTYYSGDSIIVDPMGETLHTKSHEEAIATCSLRMDQLKGVREKFPFLKDGDRFMIGS